MEILESEHKEHQEHKEHEGRNVPEGIEELARQLVDAGLKVHRTLGPGLLEGVYEQCLAHEIQSRGHECRRQVTMPIVYEGMRIDTAYRLDLLVAN